MTSGHSALLVLLLSALGVLTVTSGLQQPVRPPAKVVKTAAAATRVAAIAPSPTGKPIAADEDDLQILQSYSLIVPVKGIPSTALRDTFDERRGLRKHEALDILAPRGTPVIAAGEGRVVKIFHSIAGGLTVYQFDPRERFAYYYAHLDSYASGLTEGTVLKRGELVGFVGTSGNAPKTTPHLHFTIFRLTPEKRWWKGDAVNPLPFLHTG